MTEKLKIVYRPLKDLTPYAHNARTHDDRQVLQLVASIEEFGWTNPILIDECGEIIAGHGRVLAAEQMGIAAVPTITLSGLTDAQKAAYRIADNRLPLNAGWNGELLKLEIEALQDVEFDVGLLGFSDLELGISWALSQTIREIIGWECRHLTRRTTTESGSLSCISKRTLTLRCSLSLCSSRSRQKRNISGTRSINGNPR